MIKLPIKMKEALESGSVFEIELYTINLNGSFIHLASCDENIVFNGQTYLAVPIQRGEISHTVDNSTDSCELTVSNTTDYFTKLLFSGINPTGCPVWIYKIIYPDSLENPNLVKVMFWGQIDAPELTADGTFKVQLVSDIPKEKGGRLLQYPCNSTFGDSCCRKKIETRTGQVTSVNNVNVYVSNLDRSNKWLHGILLCNGEGRKIVEIESNRYIVEYPFLQNITNQTYTLQMDCDKSLSDCDRHNNRVHYGGFPSVPYEFGVRT